MHRLLAAVLTTVIVCTAVPASAQSRFELSGGVSWTGGFDAGGADALLSRATPGTPLTLFATSSRVDASPGVVGRATLSFNRRLGVEATGEYGRPVLRTTISDDFEQASGTEATNRVSSYLFGGSVVYRFGGRRLTPFVLGGAGYLRQLDDARVALVTGVELHAGGGVLYQSTRHVGLRVDALVSSREQSLAFEQRRRMLPVLSAGIRYRF